MMVSMERGPGNPMIVAEIGPNHEGSFAQAAEMVAACAQAGADAVKFQMYSPEELVLPTAGVVRSGPWRGRDYVDVYREGQTPRYWMRDLWELAACCGMVPFTSVFSLDAVDYLQETLSPSLYKIASGEANWMQLRERCAQTGALTFISDGLYALDFDTLHDTEVPVRCVADYPAEARNYCFGDIRHLPAWGVSDHSKGGKASEIAVAAGAGYVEVHVRKANTHPLDAEHSMTIREFGAFQQRVRHAAQMAWGECGVYRRPAWSRRWHWARSLAASTVITQDMLAAYRGNEGVTCDVDVVGRTLTSEVRKDQPVMADVLL